MRRRCLLLLPFLGLLTPSLNAAEAPVTAAPSGQLAIADFTRPTSLRALDLNPSGSCFAALSCLEGDRVDLLVYNLASKHRDLHSGSLDRDKTDDIFCFSWLNDTRLIFGVSKDKIYMRGLFTADIQAVNQAKQLMDGSVLRIVGFPQDKPDEVVLWEKIDAAHHDMRHGPIQIDATHALHGASPFETVKAEITRQFPPAADGEAIEYIADRQGHLAYAISSVKGALKLWFLRGQTWEPSPIDAERHHVVCAANEDGELLAVPYPQKGKPSTLLRIDAATGEVRAVLWTETAFNLTDVTVLSHRDGRIVGFSAPESPQTPLWLDDGYKGIHAAIAKRLPGLVVELTSSNQEATRFIALAYSDVQPGAYYLYDKNDDSLVLLGNSHPWINPDQMRPMRRLQYETRDGLQLKALVTLPAGARKGTPVPMVVLAHGGPFVRETWEWNPLVQFLANRGYAVFQPNYRGSDGYGWSMAKEDPMLFRHMSDDVADGVRFLVKAGVADPRRIAIMGTSFGGYLAVSGVVNDPELYRCAITEAGVFDWAKVLKEAKRDNPLHVEYDYLKRHLGDPSVNPGQYEAISLLQRINRVKVPVFVAHGTEDPIASLDESEALIAKLRQNRVPHEVQIEDREGHGFFRWESRKHFYERLERFLEANMQPPTPSKG